MAANLISSLPSRSISASPGFTSFLLSGGKIATRVRRIYSHSISPAALAEKPIIPPIQARYTQHLINGQFVDAASGKTFPVCDPRTGNVIAHVAEGEADDINLAVAAARKAFDEGPWPKMTPYERSRILLQFADLVDKHTEELAALESWNAGKPYGQSATIEIPMLSRLFRYYAGWADKIHGLKVPADGNSRF